MFKPLKFIKSTNPKSLFRVKTILNWFSIFLSPKRRDWISIFFFCKEEEIQFKVKDPSETQFIPKKKSKKKRRKKSPLITMNKILLKKTVKIFLFFKKITD
jgi:hypothetical protein